MSHRRRSRIRRSPPSAAAATTVADELVSRLRALFPPGASTTSSTAHQVLEETVAYVRRLHAEVDGLAERLARLMPPEDHQPPAAGDEDAAQLIIRALLM